MHTPARIGPYEIERRLATGGMAETFIALRRGPADFAQRVCLKRIRKDRKNQREFIEQFEREARIAATLRHANIVQVLDFGLCGDEPYLALEFVEGVDLEQLLADPATARAVDSAVVTRVAVEIATALDVAHRNGVLHRDVSPCNILISTEGELKLADFGIAKAPKRGDTETRLGKFKGKVAYVAPEYVRTSRVGPQGDLYSLGITLYEALCGQRPYDGASFVATLERAARGDHEPLQERSPALPARLCEIIEALIAPDPALRPPSAAALLAQLEELPCAGRQELASLARRLHGSAPPEAAAAPAAASKTDLLDSREPPARASDESWLPRWLTIMVPLLAACTTVLAGIVLHQMPSARDRSARERSGKLAHAGAARTQPPRVTAARDVQHAVPPAPTSATPACAAPACPCDSARALLRVTVVPYGEVWVDGERIGRSPATIAVAAGEHVVVAISGQSRFTRTVELAPGSETRLVFR